MATAKIVPRIKAMILRYRVTFIIPNSVSDICLLQKDNSFWNAEIASFLESAHILATNAILLPFSSFSSKLESI